jgi:hypothetical protein
MLVSLRLCVCVSVRDGASPHSQTMRIGPGCSWEAPGTARHGYGLQSVQGAVAQISRSSSRWADVRSGRSHSLFPTYAPRTRGVEQQGDGMQAGDEEDCCGDWNRPLSRPGPNTRVEAWGPCLPQTETNTKRVLELSYGLLLHFVHCLQTDSGSRCRCRETA